MNTEMDLPNKKLVSSLIDPRPQIWYNNGSNVWMAFWNGVEMTADCAWALTAMCLLHTPIQYPVIEFVDSKIRCMYRHDTTISEDGKEKFFSFEPIWASISVKNSIVEYYRNKLGKWIEKELGSYSDSDVLCWFEDYLTDNH